MALQNAGTRVTSAAVTFAHPFELGRDPRQLSPGTYRIDTHEDVFCGAFAPVYVATCVDLVVQDSSGTTTRMVLPFDLAAALARDEARSRLLSEEDDAARPRYLHAKGAKTDAQS